MATLSANQIRVLARNAGFTGNDADIAVAVALAESGGDPTSHNSTPPDDSYGLWQINMLGSLGPVRSKQYGLSSYSALYDPATNARVAHGIWQTSGWSAWSTYTSGAYKKYMDNGSVLSKLPGALGAPFTDAAKTLDVGSAIQGFGNKLSTDIKNVSFIILAIAVGIAGIVLINHEQAAKLGKTAVKAAGTAAIL